MLYVGVALFGVLALFTARSVWQAFDERAGQARAAAVFDLVATRTSTRPTDAPGAMAWLTRVINDAVGGSAAGLSQPSDAIPEALAPLIADMRHTSFFDTASPVFVAGPVDSPGSARRQRIVSGGDRFFALTRRRSIDLDSLATASPSNDFVRRAASELARLEFQLHARFGRSGPSTAPTSPPLRPVRLYAVYEDGTLLSLPWVSNSGRSAPRDAAEAELALLSDRPSLPAFAPDEFFFRSEKDAYSGFYLDLGGRGLVSTVTMPSIAPDGGREVVALDLAFDVDWSAVARSLDAPIAGAAVDLQPNVTGSWAAFSAALGEHAPPGVRAALDEANASELRGSAAPPSPLRHAVVSSGAVSAFHVSDRTWLIAWFPKTAPVFPLAAVALLSMMLVVLLAGFEVNRRRADRERRAAERALQEKQNLLNTMQVPLVVVDPNNDAIVSANRAADAIGFHAGRRFADLIWPDARARAHYERMQVASPEPRRAYGVPVAVTSDRGVREERYAIVRSVAVTAPIEALHADERHRLGVLILIDPETDLAIFTEDLSAAAHRDERRRLAGLLTHGVDTLARVLEHSLAGSADVFVSWLAEYLERRVRVTSWLLDHWDAIPPLPPDSVIDADQARATIERLADVLAVIGRDRELRSRLHWDNGTLASPDRVLDVSIDWPADVQITSPVRGGFGLFLSELVANAVRHGDPGTTPRLLIVCDRVRGELQCRIENMASRSGFGPDRIDAYGGLAIVTAMARLFEWRELTFAREQQLFVASWVVPFSTRRGPEAD